VANASPRDCVGWRYLAEVGRRPAPPSPSPATVFASPRASIPTRSIDLYCARLVGFRFVGDRTAFHREILSIYIIQLKRAVHEGDRVIERLDRILQTLALTSRFFSIVKYLIPVAGKLGDSVDFPDAVLSLTFLGHPFFIFTYSSHVRIRSRIPLKGKLLEAAIDKRTDASLFTHFPGLQRLSAIGLHGLRESRIEGNRTRRTV
jgi:hypothetical protein